MAAKTQKFRQSSARILLVSGDNIEARRLLDVFTDHGFNTFRVASLREAIRSVVDWKPNVIVSNLLIQGGSAYELLDFVNQKSKDTATIILSSHSHDGNLEEAIKRGANDYIKRPFVHEELLNRVILQCRNPIELDKDDWSDTGATGIGGLLSCAMSTDSIDRVAHNMTKILATNINSVRCSLIRAITANEGLVFASSDDPKIAGLRIDLSSYPEVQLVANTKKMIAINDLGQSRALKHIQSQVKSIQFSAMIVAPVYYKNRFFGVLSARLPESTKEVSKEIIRTTSITAKVLSLGLSTRPAEELGRFGLISAS